MVGGLAPDVREGGVPSLAVVCFVEQAISDNRLGVVVGVDHQQPDAGGRCDRAIGICRLPLGKIQGVNVHCCSRWMSSVSLSVRKRILDVATIKLEVKELEKPGQCTFRGGRKPTYHHTYPVQEVEVGLANKMALFLPGPCRRWIPMVPAFAEFMRRESFREVLTPDGNCLISYLASGAI